MDAKLAQDIAYEIDATRARIRGKHRNTDVALNILAMKIAGHIAQSDPRFNVAAFATDAGIPSKATHLVSGEYID